MVERTSDIRVLTSEIVKRLNEDARRIRSMEMNFERLESGLSYIESNVTQLTDESRSSFSKIEQDIKDLSNRILVLETNLQKIVKELEKKATKLDVKEMENYVGLMSPLIAGISPKEETEKVSGEKIAEKA